MSLSWHEILLGEESSIRDALSAIDHGSLRIAVIIDDEKHILGVVTDGDIRRGLLSGISINESVTKVMNPKPKTAHVDSSEEELFEFMEKCKLLSVPLLDDEKQIVGLQTLQSSHSKIVYDNPVFLMAGGFGTRLRPLTDSCPKPMLKVGSRPILETQILNFKKMGFRNFFISTHYMPEMISDYFGDGSAYDVSITYIYEEKPLGTGGAIGLLPENLIDLPVILMNADILTSIDVSKLLTFHNKFNATATMCVREHEYQIPYGVVEGDGYNIRAMVEKPIQRFFINAGIYVLSQDVIKSVTLNERVDMPSLLARHIKIGKDVLKFPIHEYWLDIGQMSDFKKAQLDFRNIEFFN